MATLGRLAEVLQTTPNILLGVEEGEKTDIAQDRLLAAFAVLDPTDREVLVACANAMVKVRQRT